MDEEGYPLPRLGAQLIPRLEEDPLVYKIYNNHNCNTHNNFYSYANYNTHNYIISCDNHNNSPFSGCVSSVDEESGEATGREVVVLRTKAPRNDINDPSPEHNMPLLHYTHALLHSHFLQQQSLSQKTLNLERNPLTKKYECFTSYPNDTSSSHRISNFNVHGLSPSEGREIKTRFRVPTSFPEDKQPCHRTNEVVISIRREFCRGPLVYDDSELGWEVVGGERCQWPHLQSIFGDYAKLLPFFMVRILRLVLLFLKIITPWLGLQLIYFQLFYIHMDIHLKGKKRGLEPVFVGSASQGPMIYSIRHFSCPYCKQDREMRYSLRYMERLRQERQNWDVR